MRVLIAGVAGHTGRLLAERLLIEPDIDAVTGIDARACYPPIPGLRFVRVRPRQPEWPLSADHSYRQAASHSLRVPRADQPAGPALRASTTRASR